MQIIYGAHKAVNWGWKIAKKPAKMATMNQGRAAPVVLTKENLTEFYFYYIKK